MTLVETVVSVGAGVDSLDDAEMARKPLQPPESEEDLQIAADLQEAFGRSIKAARLKAGLTQAELADRSGVRQDDVSRIEAGQVNVTIRTMGRIAKVFGGNVGAMLQTAKDSPT
ncbi:MAG: helix-turn-helix domain-containing protein, partial [Janthinobacterium lividum]